MMEKPDFDKGMPLPKKNRRRSKYSWLAEMEVDSSFTCSHQDYTAITQLPYCARQKTCANWLPDGFKLTTQKLDDGRYRIWRVA